MPISPFFTSILKKHLAENFVMNLPKLEKPSRHSLENERKNLSRAFSAYVLHKLCGIDIRRACGYVIDDIDDSGIDALYLNGPTLYVVQSKLKDAKELNEAEALKLINGVNKLVSSDFSDANAHLKRFQREAEQWIAECDNIQIVVATTGDAITKHAKVVLENYTSKEKQDGRISNNILEINSDKIVDFLLSDHDFRRVDADLLIGNHELIDNPYETICGIVSLKTLVDIHKVHGVALYQKNIRTHLGLKQKQGVNQSIQKTLTDAPQDFFYLNNGITALYETRQEKQKKDGLKRFAFTGLSVINGAQTISTAAMSGAPEEALQTAKVMITLVKAGVDTDLGRAVTKARNHQNPVNISDFIALEEIHERLRRECALADVIYQYKAGEATSNSGLIIDATQAIRALSLADNDPRYPVWLKKEIHTIYITEGSRYKAIFNDSLTGGHLINVALIDRIASSFFRQNTYSATGWSRLIYKHGELAFTWILMKMCRNMLASGNALTEEAVRQALSGPLDTLRQVFHDETFELIRYQGQPGPLALFKNLAVTVPHMRNVMIKAFSLEDNSVIPIKMAEWDPSDEYPNAAAFKYIISQAPQIRLPQ